MNIFIHAIIISFENEFIHNFLGISETILLSTDLKVECYSNILFYGSFIHFLSESWFRFQKSYMLYYTKLYESFFFSNLWKSVVNRFWQEVIHYRVSNLVRINALYLYLINLILFLFFLKNIITFVSFL